MRRDNKVILDGSLILQNICPAFDGTLNLICFIKTMSSALGGEHPVLIYGKLGVDVISFVVASKIELTDLEVSGQGWLWSSPTRSITIIEQISFHCHSSLRSLAKSIVDWNARGKDVIVYKKKNFSFNAIVGPYFCPELPPEFADILKTPFDYSE